MTQTEQMNIVIVGHVDHGKSTIIGRLLADTGSLPEGKLEQIRDLCERTSRPFEYAFLLDALKDEQSQGITIDAARVFFKTAKRHYIIIDAPGHIEFLKNMITGASRAEAALLVIDANEGVRENSRRHGYMLSMLGIQQVAVLVNKMDLVEYSQEAFERIREEYRSFLGTIGMEASAYIPVSGFAGDNVADRGERTGWYRGPTVLDALDAFQARADHDHLPFRMPVQDVYKFTRFGDNRRIIAGTVASGTLRVGDRVVFYPSGKSTVVKSFEQFPPPEPPEDALRSATQGEPAGFTMTEQIYVTRGDLAVRADEPPPHVSTRFRSSLFWLGRQPMTPGRDYVLRIGTAKVPARLESVHRLIDASTLEATDDAKAVGRHDVAECVIVCDQPLAFDLSRDLPDTGRFVIIDNYEISGGGIIQEALPDDQSWVRDKVVVRNIKWTRSAIPREDRAARYSQEPALVLVTGARESHKKDLAKALEAELFARGRFVYYLGLGSLVYGLDADIKAPGINSLADHREEHLRRFAEVAHLFLDAGTILVASAIDLTHTDLDLIQTVVQQHRTLVVWAGDEVRTDIPFDIKSDPAEPLDHAVRRITAALQERGVIFRG